MKYLGISELQPESGAEDCKYIQLLLQVLLTNKKARHIWERTKYNFNKIIIGITNSTGRVSIEERIGEAKVESEAIIPEVGIEKHKEKISTC